MPLFQNTVLKKYINAQDKSFIRSKWELFQKHFHNPVIQENIRNSKEEQYQGEFLIDLFVHVLGYTKNPTPNFNLTTEYKNLKDSKKADGAIIFNDEVKAVIELKGTETTDLTKIESQAFGYKNNQPKCMYVITSNFEKIRLYIENATEHLEFNLFLLQEQDFELLYLCLAKENVEKDILQKIKNESLSKEGEITKQLYKDYSLFKRELHKSLVALNPQFDALTLFKKSQKLLDRFLFLFFAEDRALLPPNSVRLVLSDWKELIERDEQVHLFDRFKKYFGYLNTGFKGKRYDVYPYNGGLFKPDEVLDTIRIDDTLLYNHTLKLSEYDFASEVDVNILGHIFENSLTEIEEVEAELKGEQNEKTKSKRKKDGVFYTPKYITKYIVENTVGKLCEQKKAEFDITDENYQPAKQRSRKRIENLQAYRNWLLKITICDPACGSGAFLNQALEFLIAEHRYIDELSAKYNKDAFVLSDVENSILENNLFGVDINEESVEIAKLSLWLRTAQKNRKLNDLSHNIKCGNSLIDDPKFAGSKAFKWADEFKTVFADGGFDIVIGNPPYGAKLETQEIEYYRKNYDTVIGHSEAYYIFIDKAQKSLINKTGICGFIIPNAWFSNKYASKLREVLIEKTFIANLINFNRQIIFEDANVETCILIFKIGNPSKKSVSFVGHTIEDQYEFHQKDWTENPNKIISFAENKSVSVLLKKVFNSPFKFEEKLDISNGFKPYQVGYGLNLNGETLNSEDVKNRIYHSENAINENYKPEIKGKGVKRYSFRWTPSFINWGRWLMSPKSKHYFEQPKILVRQVTGDYLFCYLDKQKFYADQSLYICTNYPEKSESLEPYLGILNSRLMGYYFRKFYSEEDDLFPKIKVNELKNLPICTLEINESELLENFVIKITFFQKEFEDLTDTYLRSVTRNFELDKPSQKMETWYDLTFKDFVKELKKKKVVLSLNQQAEWEDYFLKEQQKAQSIKSEIDNLDSEIDALVYSLYGLTEEEIKIVEAK